jgi:hypothetical protein
MSTEACHEPSPREVVKRLVLDVLGVKRVAAWCAVTDGAVWQWLSRATDERPFPVKRIPEVLRGARGDGVEFDESPFVTALGLAEARP